MAAKGATTTKTAEELEVERLEQEAEEKRKAEIEAAAEFKAAESNAIIGNIAEQDADRRSLEGGEVIKTVAQGISRANPDKPGPPTFPANEGTPGASATNPALAANNAIPQVMDEPSKAQATKLEKEGKQAVPMHGNGPQPNVG